MKTTILSFILSLLLPIGSHAQYNANYNKVWTFGYKAGLDFNSGTPVPVLSALDLTLSTEGCASVCDSFGHLLFYSNGSDVYNRNHVLMPGGSAVTTFSTSSTTQAALILPVIGSPRKYYLFSLEQGSLGDTAMCHLVYCIVDMALVGGYGDVVSTTKGTPVADSLAEKMIGVTGNNHNIWLMLHMKDTALFLAYEITNAGVSTTPVVSATGSLSGTWGYLVGVLKASSNRRKIVSQSADQHLTSTVSKFGTELYDFDPGTGIVSNCIVLDSVSGHYGAEFSPDNSKLYSDQRIAPDTMAVFQYNLALTSPAAIRASKTQIVIVPKIGFSDLKLGPDKKIYFIATDTFSASPGYSRYLNCITSPNLSGASCGYVYRAVALAAGTGMQFGLPNVYVTQDTSYTPAEVPEVSNVPALSIFPNPATTELSVSATERIHHISISDITGQEVLNREYDSEMIKIDISCFSPGVYFVRVNGIATRQFIKR